MAAFHSFIINACKTQLWTDRICNTTHSVFKIALNMSLWPTRRKSVFSRDYM